MFSAADDWRRGIKLLGRDEVAVSGRTNDEECPTRKVAIIPIDNFMKIYYV
jgi:hypothetical protein